MRRSYLPCLVFLSLITGCPDEEGGKKILPLDAGSNTGLEPCNVLTQAGCATGEKCTWFVDALMPQYVGHVGCAPSGTKNVGEACMFGAAGATGYDDCAPGLVCGNFRGGAGICKTVCDAQGGAPACDSQHVCVTYSGLFSTGDTSPPAGGVCDRACDPLADNDFDGSATASTKTGTTCGSDPTQGCYGVPSYGTPPATGWSCTTDVNAMSAQPTGLRHRVECNEANGCADPGPTIYINSCNQGYLPLMYEMSGSTKIICVAMCKPKNCYQGNCGTNNENRLGEAPHRCTPNDRVGSFNNQAGGEHCQFLWRREVDDQGNFLQSPTSDTVGFCVDHSKYLYDSNADNTPDTPLPACATLPDGFGSGSAFGAADLGCVDSTHAGATAHGKTIQHRGVLIDLPRPLHELERY